MTTSGMGREPFDADDPISSASEGSRPTRNDATRKADQVGATGNRTGDQIRRTVPPEPPRTGLPKWLLPLLAALVLAGLLWWWLASRDNDDDTPNPVPSISTGELGSTAHHGHQTILV